MEVAGNGKLFRENSSVFKSAPISLPGLGDLVWDPGVSVFLIYLLLLKRTSLVVNQLFSVHRAVFSLLRSA